MTMMVLDDSFLYLIFGMGALVGGMFGVVLGNPLIKVSVMRRMGMRRAILRVHTVTNDIRQFVIKDAEVSVVKDGKTFTLPKDRPVERMGTVPIYDFFETDTETGVWTKLEGMVKEPRDPDAVSARIAIKEAALKAGFFNKNAQLILMLGIGVLLTSIGALAFSYLNSNKEDSIIGSLQTCWHLMNLTVTK